jgi:hypothetical protein
VSKARILLEISHVYHGFYPDGFALLCGVAAIVLAIGEMSRAAEPDSHNSENGDFNSFPEIERT